MVIYKVERLLGRIVVHISSVKAQGFRYGWWTFKAVLQLSGKQTPREFSLIAANDGELFSARNARGRGSVWQGELELGSGEV